MTSPTSAWRAQREFQLSGIVSSAGSSADRAQKERQPSGLAGLAGLLAGFGAAVG